MLQPKISVLISTINGGKHSVFYISSEFECYNITTKTNTLFAPFIRPSHHFPLAPRTNSTLHPTYYYPAPIRHIGGLPLPSPILFLLPSHPHSPPSESYPPPLPPSYPPPSPYRPLILSRERASQPASASFTYQ